MNTRWAASPPLNLAFFCVVGGCVILYSIVPRIDRFVPPGRLITEREHPRLFALISDIARQMKTVMPAEVYLVPDVNAFVTQRGGILGIGSRRIMGLGMPLLAAENVSQLRAVLAHEFGHFVGGETKLAGLVYLTRSAMIRTLQNLHAAGNSMLQRPFQGMLEIRRYQLYLTRDRHASWTYFNQDGGKPEDVQRVA